MHDGGGGKRGKNKGRKEWREERKMSGCVDERDGERIKGRKD